MGIMERNSKSKVLGRFHQFLVIKLSKQVWYSRSYSPIPVTSSKHRYQKWNPEPWGNLSQLNPMKPQHLSRLVGLRRGRSQGMDWEKSNLKVDSLCKSRWLPDGAKLCKIAHFPLRWYAGTWSSKGGSHFGMIWRFLKGWFSCGGSVSCFDEEGKFIAKNFFLWGGLIWMPKTWMYAYVSFQ